MKLSKLFREAATLVARDVSYNTMCQAVWDVSRSNGEVVRYGPTYFLARLYRKDAMKYHKNTGIIVSPYWFGPTNRSLYDRSSPAQQKEYRQMRVLALLFAACIAEDEGD
ncbi:MAG: hypothetical protein MN733_06985 [Nitrososphaera sp.]|nr:hypothetical protein [Nitrososphaera sp.]